jgi:hypothetical protein
MDRAASFVSTRKIANPEQRAAIAAMNKTAGTLFRLEAVQLCSCQLVLDLDAS